MTNPSIILKSTSIALLIFVITFKQWFCLSTKEAELLKLLCQKQNQVLTREEALLAIWHDDNYFNGRSMDVFLSKLRKYLKADPKVEIMNVHGRGYKLFIH